MRRACCRVKKKKKRLTNCFKFILYLSPLSPPPPSPQGAAFLAETLSALHQTGAAVQLQSFCVCVVGGGEADFNTKALQWGNDALPGFTVYVNVAGRVVRKLQQNEAFVWK